MIMKKRAIVFWATMMLCVSICGCDSNSKTGNNGNTNELVVQENPIIETEETPTTGETPTTEETPTTGETPTTEETPTIEVTPTTEETSTVEDTYNSYVGEYSQVDDYDENSGYVSDGYLTVSDSAQEVEIRFLGAKQWTKSQNCVVLEDGKLQVTCEYYHSEAEPDDYMMFTLEHVDDGLKMTVVESDFPLLQPGDEVFFTKY